MAEHAQEVMPWRRAYEAYAAAGWFVAACWLGLRAAWQDGHSATVLLVAAFAALVCAGLRFGQAVQVLRLRAALRGKAMQMIGASELRRLCADQDSVFLGFGFAWEPEHARRLYEISKTDYRRFLLPDWVARALKVDGMPQPEHEIGLPYVHGMDWRESPLYRPLQNFEGGVCIAGTTQSGKGVMLSVLIAQAIYRGDVVIVLDPKNSARLKNNVVRACRDVGRQPPLEYHPAFPDRGIRLDPLYNWQKPSELASRIQAVMPTDSDGAFAAFGWNAVNVVVQGLVEIEERPTLMKITRYIEGGIEGVLDECLRRHFVRAGMLDWRERAARYGIRQRDGGGVPLASLVELYQREVPPEARSRSIDAQIAVYRHPREHYQKVTANLLPILSMLTSGAIGRSLSPDPFDPDDERPVMNLSKIVSGGHVLYVCLDALPDSAVASAIGAILLADLAALAGTRYNSGEREPRISLFVDEVANVINLPLVEILNKGAESGMHVTCAMQTFADLARKLGNENAARMALGNLNNLIAFRSKDRPTQEYITETFGKTYVSTIEEALSTGQDTHVLDFSSSRVRRRSLKRDEIVPADVLGKLPNLQYFASIAGGRLFKGRVPIIDPAR
ncbi:MAG TPA: conjugative transfer system coupling protein TraD [Burkholderiaceae bacterium]|nr:conjugative transfer system coupling protein TraD [Burkholderiaceae bacterium]